MSRLNLLQSDNGLDRETAPTANPRLYQPLPAHTTRLLVITGHIQEMQCSLSLSFQLCTLPDATNELTTPSQPYVALSYTWGDNSNLVPIKVKPIIQEDICHSNSEESSSEPCQLLITPNLAEALKMAYRAHAMYGPKTAQLFLWADQIVINQQDPAERAAQVTIMDRIYQNSSAVMIWIGPHPTEPFTAFSDMQTFAQAALQANPLDSGATPEAQLATLQGLAGNLLTPPTDDKAVERLECIIKFFQMPWFTRIWVWQEAVAVADVNTMVMCGDSIISMKWIDSFSAILGFTMAHYGLISKTKESTHLSYVQVSSRNLILIKKFEMMKNDPQGVRLLNLLEIQRSGASTDSRDKIFCMLPHAVDWKPHNGLLEVDYTLSTWAVYTRFVYWYVSTYYDLDFLGLCSGYDWEQHDASKGWPSWLPDLSVIDTLTRAMPKYEQIGTRDGEPLYSATGPHHTLEIRQGGIGDCAFALRLSGVRIGAVKLVQGKSGVYHFVKKPTETSEQISETQSESKYPQLPSRRGEVTLERGDAISLIIQKAKQEPTFQSFDAETAAMDAVTNDITMIRRPDISPVTYIRTSKSSRFLDQNSDRLLFDKNTAANDLMLGKCIFTCGPENGPGSGTRLGCGGVGIKPGDEVWMLKGGKVLYILRPGGYRDFSAWTNPYPPPCFDLTNGVHELDIKTEGGITNGYTFVTECYVRGLMDGELVDMMGDDAKCEPIEGMDREFREILLL